MHITMLKHSKNKLGYIQVVTHSSNQKELEDIGFVDDVSKVKAPKATAKKAVKVSKDAK
jgi:hypothetical protein